MIHLSHLRDVTERVPNGKWRDCDRKPEKLRYMVMDERFAVETEGGTLSRGKGDVLMEGGDGQLYSLTIEDWARCYGDPTTVELVKPEDKV